MTVAGIFCYKPGKCSCVTVPVFNEPLDYVNPIHAKVLTSELDLADAFEEVAKVVDPKFAALWMRDELKRVVYYNKLSFKESEITPAQIIDLLQLLQDKKVTAKAGKKIMFMRFLKWKMKR